MNGPSPRFVSARTENDDKVLLLHAPIMINSFLLIRKRIFAQQKKNGSWGHESGKGA